MYRSDVCELVEHFLCLLPVKTIKKFVSGACWGAMKCYTRIVEDQDSSRG